MPNDINTRTGWTAATLMPHPDIHAQANSVLSAPVSGAAPNPIESLLTALGLSNVNSGPTSQIMANVVPGQTGSTPLNDPSLAPKGFMTANPGNGAPIQTGASISMAQLGNGSLPGWIGSSLANLNANQALRSSSYDSLLAQILGGQNEYHNKIADAYASSVASQKTRNDALTNAMTNAQSNASELASLQAKRNGMAYPAGFYEGSDQQKLDARIAALQSQSGSAQQLGTAAASSGWSGGSAMPTF